MVATVLSHDLENDPAIVAMIGCSAALTLSGIPFFGPIAGCRVGYENGQYVLNPTLAETKTSQLDLVLAGTTEGVLMVESEASELTEEVMLGAVTFGHAGLPAGDPGDHRAGRTRRQDALDAGRAGCRGNQNCIAASTRWARLDRRGLYRDASSRSATKRSPCRQEAGHRRSDGGGPGRRQGQAAVQGARGRHRPQRRAGHRPAHRRPRHCKTVRPIVAEVGVLPRAHGSRCSPAARRRRWWWRRWAPARTSS